MKREGATHESTASWYVVQLRPNCVDIAEKNLRRQRFGVFSPRCRVKRNRAGRQREIETLLFPGYVFVSFDTQDARWRAINSTYGVSQMVTMGTAGPRSVPTALIDEIRIRCDLQDVLLPPEDFQPGDRVRVTSGPFAEFVSRVENVDPQARVWLLLDIMGRMTRVAVAQDDLSKLPTG